MTASSSLDFRLSGPNIELKQRAAKGTQRPQRLPAIFSTRVVSSAGDKGCGTSTRSSRGWRVTVGEQEHHSTQPNGSANRPQIFALCGYHRREDFLKVNGELVSSPAWHTPLKDKDALGETNKARPSSSLMLENRPLKHHSISKPDHGQRNSSFHLSSKEKKH